MNIYEKLQEMRVALQGLNIKKTGQNRHMGYSYYELGDFMPPINQLMKEHKVCGVVSYGKEQAELTLINAENPEERITFTSPMADAVLKGAHPIQNLGAVETYQRRYLYMTAFEIVEADVLDASQGAPDNRTPQNSGNNLGYKQPYGNQNAAPAANRGATRQQNTALPSDVSDQLNAKITEVKQITGMTVKEIVAELEQNTGIKMQAVTVESAPQVLEALDNIAGAWLPF